MNSVNWEQEANYIEQNLDLMNQKFQKLYFHFYAYHLRKLKTTNMILLIQNGKFYNAPCFTDSQNNDHGSGYIICDILNLQLSASSHPPFSITKMPLPGFQTFQLYDRIEKLLDQGYIVVVHNENKTKKNFMGIINREDYIIYPPDLTFTHQTYSNNFQMTIYLQKEYHSYFRQWFYNTVVLLADYSTGDYYIHQLKEQQDYTNHDVELSKIIMNYKPKSILFIVDPKTQLTEDYKQTMKHTYGISFLKNVYFQLDEQEYHKDLFTITFEKTFDLLEKPSNMDTIEYIGLNTHQDQDYKHIQKCIFYSIDYVGKFNRNFLNKMKKPVFINNQAKFMKLSDDTVFHLNIFEKDGEKESLFSIINNTKTPMGYRELKNRLLHPQCDIKTIMYRYDLIEQVEPYKTDIRQDLSHFIDVERAYNQIQCTLSKRNIQYFFRMIECWNKMNTIFKKLGLDKYCEYMNIILDYIEQQCPEKTRKSFKEMDKWQKINIFPKIEGLEEYKRAIERYNTTLNNLFSIQKEINKHIYKSCEFVYNQRNFYFTCLKKYEKDLIDKQFTLNNKQYSFRSIIKKNKSNLSLSEGIIQDISNYLIEKIEMIDEYYVYGIQKIMKYIQQHYHHYIQKVNQKIQDVDIAVGHAVFIQKNAYTKPILKQANNAFIKAKQMRHPIIEQFLQTQFIPNDVLTNEKSVGHIIYGLNASGKSVYLKSIGCCLILAQAGFYVPCESFEYYPFQMIMSRVPQGDNIHRGKSTFQIEMDEMKLCSQIANENTLILSDELCSSTEHSSAVALVGALIQILLDKKSKFFMASHIHELKKLDGIQHNPLIQIKSFQANIKNNTIEYTRKLTQEGIKEHYGLEIAGLYGLNDEFMKKAWKIRDDMDHKEHGIIQKKKSKYNCQKIMDHCEVCGKQSKQLDTHHIYHQELADKNGIINNTFHKNKIFNLQILCKQCHQKHHQEEKMERPKPKKTIKDFFSNKGK